MSTPDTDAVTLPAEWLADLRLRAEQNMGLCLNEHTIHRSDDSLTMWVTCDGHGEHRELGRLQLADLSVDQSHGIRHFVSSTVSDHERRKANDAVLTLLMALGY